MDWYQNIIKPAAVISFSTIFIGGGIIFALKVYLKAHKRTIKYYIKYKLMKKPIDKKIKDLLSGCDLPPYKLEVELLLGGEPQDKVNEILYLYKEGLKDVR